MLRKEGFEVAITATGPDALAEFDRAGADVVLLDLMLPGLPGTEVFRALRAKGPVPVIMVVAERSRAGIGSEVPLRVTSVLTTANGRMVFTKPVAEPL